jgi:hypothetical protein
MILLLFSPGFLSKSIIRASGSKVSSASLDETAALSQGREDELSGSPVLEDGWKMDRFDDLSIETFNGLV